MGCLKCLRYHANREECIDLPCQAPVKHSNVVSAIDLGTDREPANGGNCGAKLTEIVLNITALLVMVITSSCSSNSMTLSKRLLKHGTNRVSRHFR